MPLLDGAEAPGPLPGESAPAAGPAGFRPGAAGCAREYDVHDSAAEIGVTLYIHIEGVKIFRGTSFEKATLCGGCLQPVDGCICSKKKATPSKRLRLPAGT